MANLAWSLASTSDDGIRAAAAAAPEPQPAPASWGPALAARLRRLNWPAIVATVALEAVLLVALVSLGVISARQKVRQPELTVLDIRPPSQPPAAPPAEPEPRPEARPEPQHRQEPPKTEIVVPPAAVAVPTAGPPLAVAAEARAAPVSDAPKPSAAPAAPPAGSGPVSVANLNTNLLNGVAPVYPVGSRRKREQGTVVLRLVISEAGRVIEVSVQRSSGFAALDEAAVAAVRKWRWSPMMRDGRQVQITGLVQIPFVLKQS